MIECKLISSKRQTAFEPLCLLGHYLTKERVLEPLSGIRIAQKTVVHSPTQKLTDALMVILPGCKAIYETNRAYGHAPFGMEGVPFGAEIRCQHASP